MIEGDKTEAFILSFWKFAYWLGYKYKRYADPDDIAQECLLAVCQITAQKQAYANPEAYIHTAMKHAAYTLLGNHCLIKPEFAARHRHTANEWVIDCVPLASIPEDVLLDPSMEESHDDEWQWLYDLVDLLPLAQRRVIGYFFGLTGYGKLPMGDMMTKLGYSSEGSISGAKQNALRNLRKQLDPSYRHKYVVNEKLRAVRISYGWTGKEVGTMLGMKTPRNYERWERGEYVPSEENIVKLCTLFDKTPQELGY